MVKKVLIVTSVISFIEWFNKENITFLHEKLGCEVHIACNTEYLEDTDVERTRVRGLSFIISLSSAVLFRERIFRHIRR